MTNKFLKSSLAFLFILSLNSCNSTPIKTLNDPIPSPSSKVNPTNNSVSSMVLKSGSFKNGVHTVSGMVKIIKVDDKNVLSFENFNTDNGPDLFVYMIKNSSGTPSENDFINLGSLKTTNGNFNYDIPANVNINDYQSVSIWCKSFSVKFGYASF